MIRRAAIAAVIICGLMAAPAMAQSLADVARQEEARRATAKKAVRILSNADLSPSDVAGPAGGADLIPGCYVSIKDNSCVSAERMVANSQAAVDREGAKRESTFRQQAALIRQRLQKAREEFESFDATASDQSRSAGERASASRLASQREQLLGSIERQWHNLEKEVTDRQLPREWLEPIPVLSGRSPQ